MLQQLKVIKLIHGALCAGLILVYFFIGNIKLLAEFSLGIIGTANIVYLLIPLLAYVASNFLFKMNLKQIDPSLKFEEKFGGYQTASVIRWAVLEGAAFLILFISPEFMILGICIIIYLISLRPTEDRMRTDLNHLR